MSRERTFTAVIIKKQPFGEADEIVTFFTREIGKIRALAKSVKLGTSKLQQSLQPIFRSEIQLAGNGNLPKIIGVQIKDSYPRIQAEPDRVAVWFVVAELLNKSLGDEQKNESLYELLIAYLKFLDQAYISESLLSLSLIQFKIKLLDLIGLTVHQPPGQAIDAPVLFSARQGGFYVGAPTADSRTVNPETWELFSLLRANEFFSLPGLEINNHIELKDLINDFITYQLERDIKADKLLGLGRDAMI